jgi:hypothetical protein
MPLHHHHEGPNGHSWTPPIQVFICPCHSFPQWWFFIFSMQSRVWSDASWCVERRVGVWKLVLRCSYAIKSVPCVR